jgi:hypothetical protein
MEDHPLSFTSQFIPGLQDKAAGLLFAIFPFFFFFQDAEGFAGGIGVIKVFGVENLPLIYRRQTTAAGLI